LEDDVFPGSSKRNSIKASTKLFFIHRLKSKKQKNSKCSLKEEEENLSEHTVPQQDSSASPKVFVNYCSRLQHVIPLEHTENPCLSAVMIHLKVECDSFMLRQILISQS